MERDLHLVLPAAPLEAIVRVGPLLFRSLSMVLHLHHHQQHQVHIGDLAVRCFPGQREIWGPYSTDPGGGCLVGLVVKASTSRAADLGFDSHLLHDFSLSSHTSDLEIGTPVATLPGAWHYRVSTGTGWPDVSILWRGERKLDLQLLSQCGSMYSCLSRSTPEIH